MNVQPNAREMRGIQKASEKLPGFMWGTAFSSRSRAILRAHETLDLELGPVRIFSIGSPCMWCTNIFVIRREYRFDVRSVAEMARRGLCPNAEEKRKMARSGRQTPFGLAEALMAVHTSYLSCGNTGKAPTFPPVRGHPGIPESGSRRLTLFKRMGFGKTGCGFCGACRRWAP
jgi:hypothetical protein